MGVHGLHRAVLGADRGLGAQGYHRHGSAGLVGRADALPGSGWRVPPDAAGVPVRDGHGGGRHAAFDTGVFLSHILCSYFGGTLLFSNQVHIFHRSQPRNIETDWNDELSRIRGSILL